MGPSLEKCCNRRKTHKPLQETRISRNSLSCVFTESCLPLRVYNFHCIYFYICFFTRPVLHPTVRAVTPHLVLYGTVRTLSTPSNAQILDHIPLECSFTVTNKPKIVSNDMAIICFAKRTRSPYRLHAVG